MGRYLVSDWVIGCWGGGIKVMIRFYLFILGGRDFEFVYFCMFSIEYCISCLVGL